jgi:hypothetical protein
MEGTMSMALAKQAMESVWKRWGKHIPSELREYEARDVFVFHTSEDAFLTSFAPTFEKAFQPANAWLKGMSARDCASGCAAFSTAHITHATRKLHISPKGMNEPEPVVLMAHEYLHWLSHEAFYPSYYKQGGNRPFQVEGITEWLTIRCFPPGQATVVYRDEYAKTDAWIGSDSGNERRMLDFIFKGKATNLDALHP